MDMAQQQRSNDTHPQQQHDDSDNENAELQFRLTISEHYEIAKRLETSQN